MIKKGKTLLFVYVYWFHSSYSCQYYFHFCPHEYRFIKIHFLLIDCGINSVYNVGCLEKEYVKAVYCHPAYLTYIQSTWWETLLEEAQAGIKIARRNINNLRYEDDTTLMAESEEELKGLLMKMKEENEKVGLKLNIQKIKIMTSSPITSCQIDGETVETVVDFTFLAPKSLQMVIASMKLKDTYSLEGKLWPT